MRCLHRSIPPVLAYSQDLGHQFAGSGIERATVVLNFEKEVARLVCINDHLHFLCVGVSPDIIYGFLDDSIDLHLYTRREFASLFDCLVTVKLILEPLFYGRVLHGMRQRELKRSCKADVLQY